MALRCGALEQPLGEIGIFAPQVGDDLSALGRDNCSVFTAFKPDFDHFARLGYRVFAAVPDMPPYKTAVVCLPRAKAAARDLLAQASARLPAGGRLVVDGQKTDGIEAMLRDLGQLGLRFGEIISKSHGKLAVSVSPPHLQQWAAQTQRVAGDFITHAGVFSADGPDRASVMLADMLPAKLPARVADFGAGWGYLARAILSRAGVQSLDLIEADAVALACARQNITDARAAFHWADVTQHRPALPWDMVVTNPPFHTQRSPDASLGLGFITAAHAKLAGHGQLWLVANRQLPYTAPLRTLFREVEELGNDPTFRLIRAAFPVRAR